MAVVAGGPGTGARWLLMEGQRSRLVRLLCARGMDAADAEDCVQEALVRGALMDRIEPATLDALMNVITVHVAFDMHRRHGRARRLWARMGAQPEAAPDEVAVDRIMAAEAAEAARGLSSTERNVVMAAADGYKPRETAELLGMPVDSVHRALYRARRVLRAAAGGAAGWLLGWRRIARHAARAGAVGTVSLSAIGLLMLPAAPPVTAGGLPHSLDNHVRPEAIKPMAASHAPRPQRDQSAGTVPALRSVTPRSGSAAPRVIVGKQISAGPVSGPVMVVRRNGDRSLVQSVTDCLQPGALSLDPHKAGCPGA